MMSLVGRTVGHSEVQSLLGAGGMGHVYRARDTELGRSVALKFLPPKATRELKATDRFLREARAASALNHPNIITIYEIGDADFGRFIVMELIEGRTLRECSTEARPSSRRPSARLVAYPSS